VLIFRSVNNIVIAAARTGNDNSKSTTVTATDHTNRGIRSILIPLLRILIIVTKKLILPKIDEAPAKCKEKIAKSTALPLCPTSLESGGYTVQPVPTPDSTTLDISNKISAGGSNQNLRLFNRGNAISGVINIIGRSQFPKPSDQHRYNYEKNY